MTHLKSHIGKLSVGIDYPKRRFGIIAMEKGFITVDQLWEALMQQAHHQEGVPIGEILKGMGHITDSELNEVLYLMEQEEKSREDLPERIKTYMSTVSK
jgi:hypothetical protein